MALTDHILELEGTYMAAFDAAMTALLQEQSYLDTIGNGLGGTQAHRNAARAAANRIGKEIVRLDAAHVAILDSFGSTHPPSLASVESAMSLSEKLANQVQNATAFVAIVEIITNFVNAWEAL